MISGDWSPDPPASPGQVAAATGEEEQVEEKSPAGKVGTAPDWPSQPMTFKGGEKGTQKSSL